MGKELVRRQGIAGAVLLCLSCDKPAAVAPKTGEPQIRATVVTVQTTLQPEGRTITHRIVIAGDKVRSMDELDKWRIIDLKQNNVTFVDTIAKTYRTESIQSLVIERRRALAKPLPDTVPAAEFIATSAERVIHNLPAKQSVIRAGAYQRELWFASHPALPANLFAALYATEPLTSPLAPMMKNVDEALFAMRGFPLADRAELPYGKSKMIVDRNVIKVETREVGQSTLKVPRDYRDVTEPDANRRPASSRRSSRITPEAESPPSATDRKTP